MELKLKGSKLLAFCLKSERRFLIMQGGSRSSKTYSIIQYLIALATATSGKTYTICRKTLPALKATAMRDFIQVLQFHNIYDEQFHNKSEQTYNLNGNIIEFISIDQPAKIRGRKRDILFINECNELSQEDFRQLEMRTSEKIILDYNPSDQFGWHYDLLNNKPSEIDYMQSTYLDNPFLEDSIKKTIEAYKETDELFWRIFGLGERGLHKATIYNKYETYDTIDLDDYCYGLDFGYNHPTALVKVSFGDGEVYAEELLFESGLTSSDLVSKLNYLIKDKSTLIYADAARPEIIADIKKAGFNIKAADKTVKAGIDKVKSNKLFIKSNSHNMLKEIQLYKWKEVGDHILDEPVKDFDDSMDAMRYAVYNRLKKKSNGGFNTSFNFC